MRIHRKYRPVLFLILVKIGLLTTAFVPLFFESLFVDSGAHLIVINPCLAIVLSIALVLRHHWARTTVIVRDSISLIVLIIIMASTAFELTRHTAFLFLIVVQVVNISVLQRPEKKDTLSSVSKYVPVFMIFVRF